MSSEQLGLEQYQADVARRLRDSGASSSTHLADDWTARAEAALEELAASGAVFSAEDLYRIVGPAPSDGAAGALFLRAAKSKRIVNVGITRARRVTRHAGVLRTWRGSEWGPP